MTVTPAQEKPENLDPATAYVVDGMTGARTPIEGAPQPEADEVDEAPAPKKRAASKRTSSKKADPEPEPAPAVDVDAMSDEDVVAFLTEKGLEPGADDKVEDLRVLAKTVVESESAGE